MNMEARFLLNEEEMEVDERLGYPKAYAKLCRDPHLNPYSHGPPFTFTPFVLPPEEVSSARDLDKLFPVIEIDAKSSTKPRIFTSLLWKQLNHLGNAGFDPAKIRVDPYGNVLYYHADPGSPLAWDVDHWFPCSRGGKTVSCNLRILQWQVCEKKHNKLEFLVPWWDLQLGISVDQFLSIFTSSNSDFRNRAFSFLFFDGENEELNDSQSVDAHVFPQHFVQRKEKVGLAPAAIVLSRRESSHSSSVLRSVDLNRKSRARSSAADTRKYIADDNESLYKSIQLFRPGVLKENDNPETDASPFLDMAMTKDSLRRREEMQSEIQKLDIELDELSKKNEVERIALQDLESVLIKRRRRAEKSRRLAEAQSSYKALLEKMIRDAMHQSVVYKEQLRLNQAASSTLMARLEAQKAICDDSEKDLRRKFKQRDEIEKQVRPQWEQARKRSRLEEALQEERDSDAVLCLPEIKLRKSVQKELRVFLEEEHKASQDGSSPNEGVLQEEEEVKSPETKIQKGKSWAYKSLNSVENETPIEEKLQQLDIGEIKMMKKSVDSILQSPEKEDEEGRNQRGKGNVDKWLQILLSDSKEASPVNSPHRATTEDEKRTEDITEKLNVKSPQKETRISKFPVSEEKTGFSQNYAEIRKQAHHVTEGETSVEKNNTSEVPNTGKGVESCKSFEGKERKERSGKDKSLARSESARAFRAIPYSPSMIFGMRKGADCIGKKKPVIIGSDEEIDTDHSVANILKSSVRTIKKAVKI